VKQQTARLSLLSIALGLSACTTTFQETKIDYKSAARISSSLEVPPDLTQLSQDSRYTVPGGVVSAAAMQANAKPAKPADNNTAANKIGDVRIERDGAEHWLVVDRAADKLWEPTRDFWLENGFIYSMEDRQLGILETDWAENRAKLPQDIIRKSLGKVFDSLYSTSERDKFRTRLEREPDGKTRIYVTHRGMQEVYTSERKDNTIWQPRPRDPELETEFLRRIMVKLGVSEEQASAVAKADKSAATTSTGARMDTINGVPTCSWKKALSAHGALAWRWTAPASPWKTATAAAASTTCATWTRTPSLSPRASSARSSARARKLPRLRSIRSRSRVTATSPRSACSMSKASRTAPPTASVSCASSPMI
jgi:outer membrane protein assembly factor BamC